ncbi:CDP-archaeol synthase [bacterium]|jgi:CDP-diglyceride synthetase|nr:CDP-archaeol synthase [bacterium]
MNSVFVRALTSLAAAAILFGLFFAGTTFFVTGLLVCVASILIFELRPLVGRLRWWLTVMAGAYSVAGVLCLIWLDLFFRSTSVLIPLYPFLAAATADSAAYLCGKVFGRHKLAPSISPKKTWEGVAGAFFGIVILHANLVLNSKAALSFFVSWTGLAVATVLVTVAAVCGDLFASWIKRKAGVKDYGAILPGHGGLLDRLDAVFLVAIACAAWLVIFV